MKNSFKRTIFENANNWIKSNQAKKLGKKCFYISDCFIHHHISYSIGGRFSLKKMYHKFISFIKDSVSLKSFFVSPG